MSPIGRATLSAQITGCGLGPGDVVLVHSSMSAVGRVDGGAATVVGALQDVVGPGGTVVMPTFSPQLVHPACRVVRRQGATDLDREIPRFDPRMTPCGRRLGVLPEVFRKGMGVRRSGHPHTSFAAWGTHSQAVVRRHPPAWRLSASSPLGVLRALDAKILMLGTGWSTCTSLHLAEYEAGYPGRLAGKWPVPTRSEWRYVDELLVWEGDFERIGRDFAAEYPIGTDRVGGAAGRLVNMRSLTDFAKSWLLHHRDLRGWLAPPGWLDVIPW
jgi:aminoglycoside 3-N-acetyltransferase